MGGLPRRLRPLARRLRGRVVGLLMLTAGIAAFASPATDAAADAADELALIDAARAADRYESLLGNPEADTLRLRTSMALARERAGDVDGALAVHARLAADAAPGAHAAADLVTAHLALHRGSARDAVRALDEAQAALPPVAPAWLKLRLAYAQAVALGAVGRREDAVRHHLASIELADATGPDWRRATMRQALAFVYVDLGQLGSARVLVDRALKLAEASGSPVALATVLGAESHLRAEEGDRDGARRATERALELATRAGALQVEALMLGNLADDHLRAGNPAQALIYSERALAKARAQVSRDVEVLALANRGLARIGLGQLDAGKRDLEASLAIDRARGDVASMATTLNEAGAALERAGDARGAWEALARARPLAAQLVRREEQVALLELQESFDRRQRERELAALDQTAALQQARLQAQTLRGQLWAAAAAAAALTVALLGWLAARVRRSNRALRALNAELRASAERDPLTGLANRHALHVAMLDPDDVDPRLDAGVLLVDIDHFKQVNDRAGHEAGDAVLVEVARRLRQAVRGDDLVVRWGGEEFIVVARRLAAPDVERLAQRLLDGIAGEPVDCGARQVTVTASIGYARFPLADGPSVAWPQAIGLVDAALFLAKTDGRNRGVGVIGVRASDAVGLGRLAGALAEARERGEVTLRSLYGPPAAAGAA